MAKFAYFATPVGGVQASAADFAQKPTVMSAGMVALSVVPGIGILGKGARLARVGRVAEEVGEVARVTARGSREINVAAHNASVFGPRLERAVMEGGVVPGYGHTVQLVVDESGRLADIANPGLVREGLQSVSFKVGTGRVRDPGFVMEVHVPPGLSPEARAAVEEAAIARNRHIAKVDRLGEPPAPLVIEESAKPRPAASERPSHTPSPEPTAREAAASRLHNHDALRGPFARGLQHETVREGRQHTVVLVNRQGEIVQVGNPSNPAVRSLVRDGSLVSAIIETGDHGLIQGVNLQERIPDTSLRNLTGAIKDYNAGVLAKHPDIQIYPSVAQARQAEALGLTKGFRATRVLSGEAKAVDYLVSGPLELNLGGKKGITLHIRNVKDLPPEVRRTIHSDVEFVIIDPMSPSDLKGLRDGESVVLGQFHDRFHMPLSVDAKHARITRQGTRIVVEDLGSSVGTFVRSFDHGPI